MKEGKCLLFVYSVQRLVACFDFWVTIIPADLKQKAKKLFTSVLKFLVPLKKKRNLCVENVYSDSKRMDTLVERLRTWVGSLLQ